MRSNTISFFPVKGIRFEKILTLSTKDLSVRKDVSNDSIACLTLKEHDTMLWAYRTGSGHTYFKKQGHGDVLDIIKAVEATFHTQVEVIL